MARIRWRLYRSAEPVRGIGVAILLCLAFGGLALITRLADADGNGFTAFWPANAAIVVAVLTLPRRLSLLATACCFGLNIAVNEFARFTIVASVLYSLLNVGQAYLAAFLIRSLCGATTDLTRFRRLVTLTWIAFVASAAEAAIGEAVQHVVIGDKIVFDDWLQWTLCDALGLVLATPSILLVVKSMGSGNNASAGPGERWMLLLMTIALSAVSFRQPYAPLFLFLYPLLITVAFRAGAHWVLASVLIVSLVTASMTAHGYGPIAAMSPGGNLMRQEVLQLFLVSLFLAAVPANNALGEKSRIARRLRQMQINLEIAATHDALTSLMNRKLFQRQLSASLRAGSRGAILFLDLDGFKQVNDALGHQAGDELLILVGMRLANCARRVDGLVARFGGDEFALLVAREQNAMQIADLCQAINDAARAPFILRYGRAHISVSIGVAAIHPDRDDAEEHLRKADLALYAAKRAGRDRFCVFSNDLDRVRRVPPPWDNELCAAD